MKNILVFVTNHGTLGTQQEKNGTYAPELTHVLHQFIEADLHFDLVSLVGGAVPIYGDDVEDGINEKILNDEAVNAALHNTKKISDINPGNYDAVFYPGGFGLLYDLAKSDEAGQSEKREMARNLKFS